MDKSKIQDLLGTEVTIRKKLNGTILFLEIKDGLRKYTKKGGNNISSIDLLISNNYSTPIKILDNTDISEISNGKYRFVYNNHLMFDNTLDFDVEFPNIKNYKPVKLTLNKISDIKSVYSGSIYINDILIEEEKPHKVEEMSDLSSLFISDFIRNINKEDINTNLNFIDLVSDLFVIWLGKTKYSAKDINPNLPYYMKSNHKLKIELLPEKIKKIDLNQNIFDHFILVLSVLRNKKLIGSEMITNRIRTKHKEIYEHINTKK